MQSLNKPMPLALPIMRGLTVGLISFSLTALAAKGASSSVKAGITHYTKGEFKEAIVELQKALTLSPSQDEKTKAYKFMGLSYYTLGQKPAAEESFKNCLKQGSGCVLKKDEALDESVLPFFAGLKDKQGKAPAKADAAKPTTHIFVECNAPGAEIMIDGIIAGSAGSLITAPPGTIEIEVHAKGFKPRKLKAIVVKNKDNRYQLTLEKLPVGPSKEELARAAAAKEKAQQEAQAKDKARKQAELAQKDKGRSSGKARKGDEDGPDKAASKDTGDALFGEEERKDKELEKTSPKFDETLVSDGKSPGVNEKMLDILEDDKGPRSKKPSEGKTASASSTPAIPAPPPLSSPISLLHFMPLGLGQIKNGDYVLGAIVAGAQAYGAYLYLGASSSEQNARDNYLAAYNQARTDPTITPQDLVDLQTRSTAYINKQQQAQTMYGLVFLGAYGFGVLQGIFMRPDLPPASSPKSTQLESIPEGWRWSLAPQGLDRMQLGFTFGF